MTRARGLCCGVTPMSQVLASTHAYSFSFPSEKHPPTSTTIPRQVLALNTKSFLICFNTEEKYIPFPEDRPHQSRLALFLNVYHPRVPTLGYLEI